MIFDDNSSKFNSLNQYFYEVISQDFNDSRKYFWKGWENLWDLQTSEQIKEIIASADLNLGISKKNLPSFKVLDLGCGNARFYEFLEQKLKSNNVDKIISLQYTGIDFTQDLLLEGTKKYQDKVNLIHKDVLVDDWIEGLSKQQVGQFDLIVAFGLIHHLSSGKLRDSFFKSVQQVLSLDGTFVFASWNFVDNQALMSRKADLNSPDVMQYLKKFGLKNTDFAAGDYLLDWQRGSNSWRFCHYYTQLEVEQMLQQYNFKLIDKYQADGKNELMNTYWITKPIK